MEEMNDIRIDATVNTITGDCFEFANVLECAYDSEIEMFKIVECNLPLDVTNTTTFPRENIICITTTKYKPDNDDGVASIIKMK